MLVRSLDPHTQALPLQNGGNEGCWLIQRMKAHKASRTGLEFLDKEKETRAHSQSLPREDTARGSVCSREESLTQTRSCRHLAWGAQAARTVRNQGCLSPTVGGVCYSSLS